MNLLSDLATIKPMIADRGWAIVKTPETVEVAKKARDEYFASFQSAPLQTKGFSYEELQRSPIRKQNIGSRNGLGQPYAQVLQSTYYPSKIKQANLQRAFTALVGARNQLTGMPLNYGDRPEIDGYWNACRVHHYPRGGGFMMEHIDSHFSVMQGESFLQVLFLLSERGKDFQSGGGFIKSTSGEFVDLEEVGGIGAVVFFDGRILHGVNDIDPGTIFSFDEPNGRLSVVANLYKYIG